MPRPGRGRSRLERHVLLTVVLAGMYAFLGVALVMNVSATGSATASAQVLRLDRARHRPDAQLSIGELDLGAADAQRAVTSESGHREVLARRQESAYSRGELRLS